MITFIETICIQDGIPQNLMWHQQRIDATLRKFYSSTIPFLLQTEIAAHNFPKQGKIKCRIVYDKEIKEISFSLYPPKTISALQCIEIPEGYNYPYKFADRSVIDDLFAQKGIADDILMTHHGYILDTSIANIAFQKNDRWYTPSLPLLAGTTWKRLISTGVLIPRPIHQREIRQFDSFKLFNAMNDWEEVDKISCEEILL